MGDGPVSRGAGSGRVYITVEGSLGADPERSGAVNRDAGLSIVVALKAGRGIGWQRTAEILRAAGRVDRAERYEGERHEGGNAKSSELQGWASWVTDQSSEFRVQSSE